MPPHQGTPTLKLQYQGKGPAEYVLFHNPDLVNFSHRLRPIVGFSNHPDRGQVRTQGNKDISLIWREAKFWTLPFTVVRYIKPGLIMASDF